MTMLKNYSCYMLYNNVATKEGNCERPSLKQVSAPALHRPSEAKLRPDPAETQFAGLLSVWHQQGQATVESAFVLACGITRGNYPHHHWWQHAWRGGFRACTHLSCLSRGRQHDCRMRVRGLAVGSHRPAMFGLAGGMTPAGCGSVGLQQWALVTRQSSLGAA